MRTRKPEFCLVRILDGCAPQEHDCPWSEHYLPGKMHPSSSFLAAKHSLLPHYLAVIRYLLDIF
jgi:hypothetical protein